jgi:hypothetical protein
MKRLIAPLSDNEIISKIEKLNKKYPSITSNMTSGFAQLGLNSDANQLLEYLKKTDSFSISNFTVAYGSIYFQYIVGQNSSPLPEIQLLQQNGNQAQNDQQNFVIDFLKLFGVPPVAGPSKDGTDAVAAGYSKIESTLSLAIDRFYEIQEKFQNSSNELRESHRLEIESLRYELLTERNVLREETDQKKAELDAERKALDDRSNTSARRAIRQDLKKAVENSLSTPIFSVNAKAARLPIRIAYLGGIVAVGSFAAYSLLAFQSSLTATSVGAATGSGAAIVANVSSAGMVIAAIKSTLSLITTVGLLLLYLRWEQNWASKIAQFEENLASTKIDIDRASWVVESVLEWNKESPDKPIPPELLQSITRRLFDWDAKLEEQVNPADSLASAILGSASKLHIGKDGAQIELNQKGIKQLAKDA